MDRQDRPEGLCLRLCHRTVVILPKQGGIGMAEVLRGQAGGVVLDQFLSLVGQLFLSLLFPLSPFPLTLGHNNPMRRQCQFTVKRSERRVDLTVAAEQQPCGVQVVEWVGLIGTNIIIFKKCRITG